MREILFRGKRRDTGEWVDGLLFNEYSTFLLRFLWKIQHINKFGMPIAHYEIDPETVGQFTGLTDKNGTRIFEGDIVRVERWLYSGENKKEREVFNGVVWYDEKRTCFGLRSTKYRCLPIARFKGDYITVIGNIHDNPELLGGDRNETQ